MFGKNKIIPTVELDLRNIVSIKGYVPAPEQRRAYVFMVPKLRCEKVLGVTKDRAIEVAIASATLTDPEAISVYGENVIVVDKSTASLAKWPWSRTELLAMIAAENGAIFNDHPAMTVSNTDGFDIEFAPERATRLIDGGVPYGWNAARKGCDRANRVLDRSLKPIVKDLHRQYKAGVKAAAKGDPAGKTVNPFDPNVTKNRATDVEFTEDTAEPAAG